MVALLDSQNPARAFARYLPELKREHQFWSEGGELLPANTATRRVVRLADGSLLNRYWDDSDRPRDESWRTDWALARQVSRPAPDIYRNIRAAAESGWDFSSRWFADGKTQKTITTTNIIPVDLNSLLYGLEQAIAQGCDQVKDSRCASDYRQRAKARRAAIDRYLWNEKEGVYYDYDIANRRQTKRLSAATLYPLFAAAASQNQADGVATITQARLLKAGGIVTTPIQTGQQWDAPNGWAPLQWIAVSGLVYRQKAKLMEKYDVVTLGRSGGGGEYPTQDGFGWTNGVTRRLMADYKDFTALASVGRCPALR
jgi:alpha,alpha-trehalase